MAQTLTPVTRTVDAVDVPRPGVYDVDPTHTHVGFAARHLMVSKVRGTFTGVAATVTIADEPLESSVEATIELASVDTGDAQRDGHLRSPDFFDVEQFPTMTFRSTGLRRAHGDYELDGELTVKGVTRPLSLTLAFEGASLDPWGGERIGFSATGTIDREAFGLTWNQALETGGVLVGKRIAITIEAEAVRRA